MTLDPVAVALKFGFIAVLYLFLLWDGPLGAQGPAQDLRRADAGDHGRGGAPAYEDATGMHVSASQGLSGDGDLGAPRLRVERGRGPARRRRLRPLATARCWGRGDQVDIQLEDSSPRRTHARLPPSRGRLVLEDLGSTNGTYLNGEPLRGPQPLHAGDRIRIGDSEFTFER